MVVLLRVHPREYDTISLLLLLLLLLLTVQEVTIRPLAEDPPAQEGQARFVCSFPSFKLSAF